MFQHIWELWGSPLCHQWFKKNWMRESFGSVVFPPSSSKDLQNWCQGRFKHLWRHPVAQNPTETLNAGFSWNLSRLCISSGHLLSQIFHIHHFLQFFSPFQQHYFHCNNRELKVMVLSPPSLAFGDLLGSKGGTLVDVRYRYICIQYSGSLNWQLPCDVCLWYRFCPCVITGLKLQPF